MMINVDGYDQYLFQCILYCIVQPSSKGPSTHRGITACWMSTVGCWVGQVQQSGLSLLTSHGWLRVKLESLVRLTMSHSCGLILSGCNYLCNYFLMMSVQTVIVLSEKEDLITGQTSFGSNNLSQMCQLAVNQIRKGIFTPWSLKEVLQAIFFKCLI